MLAVLLLVPLLDADCEAVIDADAVMLCVRRGKARPG